VIIEFDDRCWSSEDHEWKKSLVELLTLLAKRGQHAILAMPDKMLSWCRTYLTLHVDYFKTRLASAQLRASALRILISPSGADSVQAAPPWSLNAQAAYDIVNKPLQIVLENDISDKTFVESTIPPFATWCSNGWIEPVMGGGSHMRKKILAASDDSMARWRTFYLFDSDRLHPTELTSTWGPPPGDACQGHAFEQACANMPHGRWHRLERRSIENYLPQSLLSIKSAATSAALFDAAIGNMAHFYNFKEGLSGDGVHPVSQSQLARASRSQGFWTSLSPDFVLALQGGFGKKIAEEFSNIPASYIWPMSVINEMDALSDALQDAI